MGSARARHNVQPIPTPRAPHGQGGDLRSALSGDVPPAWHPAGRQIALDIAAALVYLHAQSVTHRCGGRAAAEGRGGARRRRRHVCCWKRGPYNAATWLGGCGACVPAPPRHHRPPAAPAPQGPQVQKRAADQGWAGQGGGRGHCRAALAHLLDCGRLQLWRHAGLGGARAAAGRAHQPQGRHLLPGCAAACTTGACDGGW